MKKMLFTGGSGLLGGELKKIFREADFPSSNEFNITDMLQMENYLKNKKYDIILHAAAFTSPPKIDEDPERALNVNIIGTANMVKLAKKYNIKLIYLSTDYVFSGSKGCYREEDELFPVNKYAWSKLGGECAVRLYDNSLIIRTSFGPNKFPYKGAFNDQWTSRESVSVIARKIAGILDKDIYGVLHIGGERKTVYEYAKKLNPEREIDLLSIRNMKFNIPVDTSLNIERYNNLVAGNSKTG